MSNLCLNCLHLQFDVQKLTEAINKCIRLWMIDTHTIPKNIDSGHIKQILNTLHYPVLAVHRMPAFFYQCTTEIFMGAIQNSCRFYDEYQLEMLCQSVWESNKADILKFKNDEKYSIPTSIYLLVVYMSEIVSILSLFKTIQYLDEKGIHGESTFVFGANNHDKGRKYTIFEAQCLIAWSEQKRIV